jgi:hypothetical protein
MVNKDGELTYYIIQRKAFYPSEKWVDYKSLNSSRDKTLLNEYGIYGCLNKEEAISELQRLRLLFDQIAHSQNLPKSSVELRLVKRYIAQRTDILGV